MMKRNNTGTIISASRLSVIILLTAIAAYAADVATFQSTSAKDAQTRYLARIEQIKKDAVTLASQAKDDYLATLSKAQADAMQHNDLDEAIRIRDAMQKIKEADDTDKTAQLDMSRFRRLLEARLSGTKWYENKPGIIWTLNPDGSVISTDGRQGSWGAIGASTILIMLDNGNVDQWTFNESLTTVNDLHAHLGDPWQSKRAN